MRLVVVVILSSFLLGNSFFKELFGINILIHHYQEHKQIEPEISFFKFLSQHYTNKINHADDEHNDHENLPFKTKDCHLSSVFKIIQQHVTNRLEINIAESYSDIPSGSNRFYSSISLSNIWQPPRLV